MTKRIVAMILSCVFFLNPMEIKAETGNNGGISINNENLKNCEETYDIPKEVVEYIEETLSTNQEAQITVYSPENMLNARGSSGSWSSVRTYNGYTLKDWNVEVTNAFAMTEVMTGSSSTKFANTLLLYGAGVLLDSFLPFGSTGLTIADFISTNGDTLYATSGDKVEAAPMYTSNTKFTYVKIGTEFVLGARTHKATLQQISWYLYSDYTHKQYVGIKGYNITGRTMSYNSPDSKAISGTGIGGYIESDIYVSINGKRFVLN